MDLKSSKNLQLEQTGIHCYTYTTLSWVWAKPLRYVGKLWVDLYVAITFYIKVVTYVLWTDIVYELKY